MSGKKAFGAAVKIKTYSNTSPWEVLTGGSPGQGQPGYTERSSSQTKTKTKLKPTKKKKNNKS